jgi:alkylresorcinol/alkylpyrone synthase
VRSHIDYINDDHTSHREMCLWRPHLPHPNAFIQSLATAVPEHVMTQEEIGERTRRVFGLRMPEFDRLAPVFDHAGIAKRHSVRPGVWYEATHTWTDRTVVYLEAATALFVQCAQQAIARAGLVASDIDIVVTVSSTGIAAPSLEARASKTLGLPPNVRRVPIFGLGCAGGVTGLAVAARLAEAQPGANVLVVAVELCTLAVRLDQLTKANIVALALFGDGAAAAVVRAGDTGLACIGGAEEYTWPDTLDIMGWNVDEQGFGVIFDRSIPPFALAHLAPAVETMLERQGLRRRDVQQFICHPGGKKVIEALETSLDLAPGALEHERAVLSEFGNMSAPTALFVLERTIAAGLPATALLMALGPGFTLSTVLLHGGGAAA